MAARRSSGGGYARSGEGQVPDGHRVRSVMAGCAQRDDDAVRMGDELVEAHYAGDRAAGLAGSGALPTYS